MPPKFTAEALLKLVPLILTVVPVVADVGVKELILGGGKKVNPVIEPCPVLVITVILPEAPLPTNARTFVAETTVKPLAAIPPKYTAVVPVKLEP